MAIPVFRIAFMSTRYLLLFFAAGLLFVGGCSWSQAPRPSETFELQWDVQEPTRSQPEAEIILSDDGFWGFLPSDRDRFDQELSPGDLVVMEAESADFLFAIIEVSRWGYRMQRLDDRSLQSRLTGYLRPLSASDIREKDELCLIAPGQQLSDVCGSHYTHQRWHLYEVDSNDAESAAIKVRGDLSDRERPTAFPISRFGLASGDLLGAWTDTTAEQASDTDLLAIRSSGRDGATLKAQVVYDPTCFEPLLTSSRIESQAIESGAAPYLTSTHPLAVETAAARLGADALVDCVDGSPRLHVPSLTRSLLRDDRGRYLAPSAIGLLPRELGEASKEARQAWVTAGAFIAVGDTTSAAFWIERALRHPLESDELKALGLVTIPVLASAGQSELAIRLGLQLTRRGWNPENVPDYLDGLIVLLGQFDMQDEQQERIKRRQSLASQRRDPHRTAWYRWASLRLNLENQRGTHGPSYKDLIADLEDKDLEEWALAVWATLAMHGSDLPVVDDPEELLPRFSRQGADELWQLIITGPTTGACSEDAAGQGCVSHSYGWSPGKTVSDQEAIQTLRTTAPNNVRRGYSHPLLVERIRYIEAPSDQTAYWVAAAPLVPSDSLSEVTTRLVTSLREQLARNPDSICEDQLRWQARFDNAAARTRTPVMDRSRRQWVNFIDWWAESGLIAICDGESSFIDALEARRGESSPWTALVLPILEDMLLRVESPVSDVSLFQRAAQLASDLGDRDTCALWSLGMSIGAARSSHFDAAEKHLISATNCMQSSSELRGPRNIVAGYIEFERAAGRNIISDSAVGDAIDRTARKHVDDSQTCVGLLPLGFDLESQLPSSIVRIAARVQMAPAPHSAFALSSASSVIDEAQAAYLTGVRDLRRGYIKTASRSLELARGNFQRLGHAPGLARIRFIDEAIYGGELARVAAEKDVELTQQGEAIEAIRSGQSHQLIPASQAIEFTDSERHSALIAALLINGREQEILSTASVDLLPPSLCRSPFRDESDEEVVREEYQDGPPIFDSLTR